MEAAAASGLPFLYLDLEAEQDRAKIEIKRSLSPKLERGFHSACADLKPARKIVIYPGHESYRIAEDIEAMSPLVMASLLADAAFSGNAA